MSLLVSLITLLMVTCLASSVFAIDLVVPGLNPTQYVIKGSPAPFSGYVVEQERLQKCAIAVQDADYYRSLGDLQKQYYEDKLASEKKIADLTLALQTKESAAVEKGLKEELAIKSTWYRQPWFTISATALVFIATGVLAP